MSETVTILSIEKFLSFQCWDSEFVGKLDYYNGLNTTQYSLIYGKNKFLPMNIDAPEFHFDNEQGIIVLLEPEQESEQEELPVESEPKKEIEYIDEVDKYFSQELDLEPDVDDEYTGNHTIDELFALCDKINKLIEMERNPPYTGYPKKDDAIDETIEIFMETLDDYGKAIEIKLLGLIPNAGYDESMFIQFRRVKTNDGVLNLTLHTYVRILDDLLSTQDNDIKKYHLDELVTCVSRFRERDRQFNESVIVEQSNQSGIGIVQQPKPEVKK